MKYEAILEAAENLNDELVAMRRKIHRFAEVGFDLDQTIAFVKEKLTEFGITYEECGNNGLVAMVGEGENGILLRADMDALPMEELSDLPFAASNGCSHACGHDCHTAMLLGAAKLLKENEPELKGVVKLMFQPAEEILSGAKSMVMDGILENPPVNAAFALHVLVGEEYSKSGIVISNSGTVTRSGDAFDILVKGKDAHGSMPYKGVDAINIASFINMALQSVIAREVPSDENNVLLTGTVEGGTTSNSLAGTAKLGLSLRTGDNSQRSFLIKRLKEVSKGISESFRGEAEVKHLFGTPALVNDSSLGEQLNTYIVNLLGEDGLLKEVLTGPGPGEDFAYIGEKVPSFMMNVGFGSVGEGYTVGMHNPKVIFNEDALKVGTAVHVAVAMKYLEEMK